MTLNSQQKSNEISIYSTASGRSLKTVKRKVKEKLTQTMKNSLRGINDPYLKSFPFVSSCVLLQKTEPKEGYHAFHGENLGWNSKNRSLAWMVYLNDVEEEGETEFLYQELKLKPKKGRVVIWPGSFTHLHRGNPPRSTKYIATGWYACCEGMEERYVSPMGQP